MTTVRILLDHDIEGCETFLKVALKETGWDDILDIGFIRLRDLSLPTDCSDQEIWRRIQKEQILLITRNRNRDDETSLQATIEKENTATSLPVITLTNQDRLSVAEYRQLAVHKLAEVVLYLGNYLGVGRIYIP